MSVQDLNTLRALLEGFELDEAHCTPTADTLRRIIEPYLDKYEAGKTKPINILVITDGKPSKLSLPSYACRSR